MGWYRAARQTPRLYFTKKAQAVNFKGSNFGLSLFDGPFGVGAGCAMTFWTRKRPGKTAAPAIELLQQIQGTSITQFHNISLNLMRKCEIPLPPLNQVLVMRHSHARLMRKAPTPQNPIGTWVLPKPRLFMTRSQCVKPSHGQMLLTFRSCPTARR